MASTCRPPLDLLQPPFLRVEKGRDPVPDAERVEERLQALFPDAFLVSATAGTFVDSGDYHFEGGFRIRLLAAACQRVRQELNAGSLLPAGTVRPGTVRLQVGHTMPLGIPLRTALDPLCATTSPPLALPLGLDTDGRPVVVDLRAQPHLMVAGGPGTSKTTFLRTLLTTLIMRCDPQQLRLVLISASSETWAPFGGLRHLACVTGRAQDGHDLLRWIAEEVDRRFRLLAGRGVRSIQSYNEREAGNGGSAERLPFLVVAIDDIAPLVAGRKHPVEEAIAALSISGRAVGIHLIAATSCVSPEVIGGLVKANLPARIAFRLTSDEESVMVDVRGADGLFEHGDALYLAPTATTAERRHTFWISDEEIRAVVDWWDAASVAA
ncbi:MAG: FtsK/SpoIIIE domain-containing protein [Vicinamibacterales bacterium]